MSDVWYGTHGIKFSEDFRQMVYKINPVYLSCMYKSMFETNATNNLRHLEETYTEDNDLTPSASDENRESSNDEADDIGMMGRVYMEGKRTPGSLSRLNNTNCNRTNIIRSCSMPSRLTTEKKYSNRQGINGWEICPRPHSAHCSGYQRHTIAETREMHRNRSRSANCKREKTKLLKVQNIVYRPGNEINQTKDQQKDSYEATVKDKRDDVNVQHSSSAITGSYCSTPGYITASSPIRYKFKHFDYSKNYIEQYRDEYTYRKITSPKSNTSSCQCDVRVPNTCIPMMPMMPLFRWVETSGVSKPREDRRHRDVKEDYRSSSPLRTVANKRAPNGQEIGCGRRSNRIICVRINEGPDMSQQSTHYLLSQNGVLRMEYYDNPLTIDNSCQKDRVPVVCRSRPSIPSNAHGNLHPSSTDSDCRTIYHRKRPP